MRSKDEELRDINGGDGTPYAMGALTCLYPAVCQCFSRTPSDTVDKRDRNGEGEK